MKKRHTKCFGLLVASNTSLHAEMTSVSLSFIKSLLVAFYLTVFWAMPGKIQSPKKYNLGSISLRSFLANRTKTRRLNHNRVYNAKVGERRVQQYTFLQARESSAQDRGSVVVHTISLERRDWNNREKYTLPRAAHMNALKCYIWWLWLSASARKICIPRKKLPIQTETFSRCTRGMCRSLR